jgi:hypothetical protein
MTGCKLVIKITWGQCHYENKFWFIIYAKNSLYQLLYINTQSTFHTILKLLQHLVNDQKGGDWGYDEVLEIENLNLLVQIKFLKLLFINMVLNKNWKIY